MPPKPKKKKPQPEQDDRFIKLTSADLTNEIAFLREQVSEMQTKRNYIQMDRDMVEQFYTNTLKENDQIKIKIVNRETEMQKLEQEHRIDVKVYLQKVKHLEFQQERTNKEIEQDGKSAKVKEDKYHQERIENMKQDKQTHKQNFEDSEKANIGKVVKEEDLQESNLQRVKSGFDRNLQDLIADYEKRCQDLKEELELKLKVEIHQLEERQNLHINELMNNHEKAFAQLQQYYNDITAENLNLIQGQKQEIANIHNKIQTNGKQLIIKKEKNAELKEPLGKAKVKRDQYLDKIQNFTNHKQSLENLQSKLINLNEKTHKLQNDYQELEAKYTKILKEKFELENKFENITVEVKKTASLQNHVLSEKLQNLMDQYEAKEIQMQHVIQQAGLEPSLYQQLMSKIQISIEQKNSLVKNLKYSIHHATKAYNDAIRVYEAKLVEFGIPPEELGFQPIQTITSTMPAGLVSS